ncbi:hypothetical protein GCM10009802_07640 [Streptomyces synnematoformans]|uniref:Tetratricopeptide repeat protein n=1 Tax=Streptomyces synnematoformans TaxID=415721 RepID=A0ABN2XE64_9ACTN
MPTRCSATATPNASTAARRRPGSPTRPPGEQFERNRNTSGAASVLVGTAELALATGDTAGARELYAQALARYEAVDATTSAADCREKMRRLPGGDG